MKITTQQCKHGFQMGSAGSYCRCFQKQKITLNTIKHMKNQTILEQFRELQRKRKNLETGCAICGSNEDHDKVTDTGTFTHQFDAGREVKMMDTERFLTTIKDQMLECVGEDRETIKNRKSYPTSNGGVANIYVEDYEDKGYNQAKKEMREKIINKF